MATEHGDRLRYILGRISFTEKLTPMLRFRDDAIRLYMMTRAKCSAINRFLHGRIRHYCLRCLCLYY